MSDFDSDGSFDGDWNDRGDLAWNEFDWERYLREQDETLNRYIALYENFLNHPQRIDEVARHMDWDDSQWDAQEAQAAEPDGSVEEFRAEPDVYTPHKNPIYISSKALYLRARRTWELLAAAPAKVPQELALAYLSSLHQGEDLAQQAIHALEFGDYAMAISLFKRALASLNRTLALLNGATAPAVTRYRQEMLVTLFDLREIWLRVISECRSELERPVEDDED
ncbi:MAG: hypothetical protein RIS54_2133 [Verrucomicrobiota bacterium]|jgi:tetratricopeptide (TPR) repeat protein